ncbi:GDSL-type esterase/lipase family protein [Micromonospora sp. NPDC049204]|uniref:GDSL-type esterase/lipase family protein n=1 Tax=unclassified Micromonospora TaxID=2617518 RepID=UPI0033EC4F4B
MLSAYSEEPGATGSRCDLRVCFFGDSFTTGVGDPSGVGWVGHVAAAARAQGHDLTVYNMGVRRDTSLDVAQRWLPEARVRLKDGQAFGVVFAFGTNDVDMQLDQVRVPPGRSLALLAAMLDDAHAARWHTLVVGPPPVLDPQASKRAADLAAAMARVCTTRSVPFVDVTELSADPVWCQEIAAGDAYHPFAAGYTRLAALVEPGFLRWLAGMQADLRHSLGLAGVAPTTRALEFGDI